jgi:hypothetical protein
VSWRSPSESAELVAMVNQECAAFGEIAVVAGAVNRR